jgi:hypothetical protein
VVSGTGRYTGATGSIAMEGFFTAAAVTAEGTVDGTILLPPPTPSSWRDGLRGGRRDLVDHRAARSAPSATASCGLPATPDPDLI